MFDVNLEPFEESDCFMSSLGPLEWSKCFMKLGPLEGSKCLMLSWSRPLEIRLLKTLPRTSRPLASLPLIFPRRDKVRGGLECFMFSHSVFASNRNSCRIAFGSLRVSSACFGLVAAAGWLILPLVSAMGQMSTAMFTLLMRRFEVLLWMRANEIPTCFFTLLLRSVRRA